MFVNIHSHKKALVAGEWVCRNAFHCLSEVSLKKLPYPVSVGLHPWHAQQFSAIKEELERKCALIQVVAIGEIGLDKACTVPFALQQEVFLFQMQWAHTLRKPMIIHGVRSYNELYVHLRNSAVPFLLHGFQGSVKEMEQFLHLPNSYFSFGKQLFRAGKGQLAFREVPADRFFLETDNSTFKIDQVYAQAMLLRPSFKDSLHLQIQQNRTQFFHF